MESPKSIKGKLHASDVPSNYPFQQLHSFRRWVLPPPRDPSSVLGCETPVGARGGDPIIDRSSGSFVFLLFSRAYTCRYGC